MGEYDFVKYGKMNMHVSAAQIRGIVESTKIINNIQDMDDNTKFSDFGVDSLDMFSILLAIEESYGIKIPDADAEKMNSIVEIATQLNVLLSDASQ